jgi:hypothetical protein
MNIPSKSLSEGLDSSRELNVSGAWFSLLNFW